MEENTKPSIKQKLTKFYGECLRVLTITKKPDSVEFKTIVKVSALGIAVIGIIGFILAMIKQLTIG